MNTPFPKALRQCTRNLKGEEYKVTEAGVALRDTVLNVFAKLEMTQATIEELKNGAMQLTPLSTRYSRD